MRAASSGESCSSVSTWKIIAGSPVGSLPFGFSGSFPTRRSGGFARCSDSSDTSLRRRSFISDAGRYSPGSACARFSTQL